MEDKANDSYMRDDAGKTRYDLIPPLALDYLAQVFTFGAQKYEARRWERGMEWGRVFGSAMRHLWAFWRGEGDDSESGLPHLAHAAWNVIVLLDYFLLQRGTDDRPRCV